MSEKIIVSNITLIKQCPVRNINITNKKCVNNIKYKRYLIQRKVSNIIIKNQEVL